MILVLLHGWGHDSTSWDVLRSQIHTYKVLSPDLPGFGNEPALDSDAGIPEYVAWLETWMSKHALKDVILVGHSFGGRISASIASKNPPWLKGLVLYGAPCLYRPSLKTRLLTYCAQALKPLHRFLPQINAELRHADAMGLGKTFRKVVHYDQTQELSKITVPTELIWGENDTDVPITIAREMKTHIPHSHLTLLHNLGHNAHRENPGIFYGTLSTFIENV